jgi:hypothetical protein
MPEYHTEIHCGVFADRITEHIKERARGPLYIGNSITRYQRYEEDLSRANFCVEGDWKRFDSTITSATITLAFCILRCFYVEDDEIDNHFLAILDSIINKDYLIKGGRVVRSYHGLPSGSKLTSLLGSIYNLLILNYVFSEVNRRKRHFSVGGDDFVVHIGDNDIDRAKLELSVYEKSEEIGMELKFLKICELKAGNLNDFPVFYKYTVVCGEPYTPAEALYTRAFSPYNKKYSDNFELLSFLKSLIPTMGKPSSHCVPFYYYIACTEASVTGGRPDVSYWFKWHTHCYNKMLMKSRTRLGSLDDEKFLLDEKKTAFVFEHSIRLAKRHKIPRASTGFPGGFENSCKNRRKYIRKRSKKKKKDLMISGTYYDRGNIFLNSAGKILFGYDELIKFKESSQ